MLLYRLSYDSLVRPPVRKANQRRAFRREAKSPPTVEVFNFVPVVRQGSAQRVQPMRQLRFRSKEHLQVRCDFLHDDEAERHISSMTRIISPLTVIRHGRGLCAQTLKSASRDRDSSFRVTVVFRPQVQKGPPEQRQGVPEGDQYPRDRGNNAGLSETSQTKGMLQRVKSRCELVAIDVCIMNNLRTQDHDATPPIH